jgi:hypothetical protein
LHAFEICILTDVGHAGQHISKVTPPWLQQRILQNFTMLGLGTGRSWLLAASAPQQPLVSTS